MNDGATKPAARRTLKSAAFAAALLLHLVALFDAEGLKTWAERLKDERAQAILLPPLDAWYGFSRAVGAAAVRSFIRDSLFAPVRDARWPEGAIAAGSANTAANSAETATTPRPSPAAVANTNRPTPTPAVETTGPMPSPAAAKETEAPLCSPERPLDVIVLGDSLAGLALPPMLNQAVARNKSVRVVYETHNASSIARPIFFDWPAEIRRIFAARQKERGRPFDLAVVVLGSNDAQAIKSGGRYYDFGTDGWNGLFRARAAEFMKILSDGCGRVYWCGVPPMRKEGYRERMVALNGLYRDVAAGFPAVRWVPLDFLGDERGRYVQTKVIGNAEREIRAADGVHLAVPGAELVVNRLIGLINEDFLFASPDERPAASNVGP